MELDFPHIFILGLVALSFGTSSTRISILRRDREAWFLDGSSLLNHFVLLPLIQMAFVFTLYAWAIPNLKGSLNMGWGIALLANMLIDYAWYWNHRAFHAQTKFWNLHAVHHEPRVLDVLASARNSLISPAFMVYFWLTPLVIYLAKDPVPFLTIAGIGLIINFWGHTRFDFPQGSIGQRLLAVALIQPKDHFWHHSVQNTYCNFGTVFNFWDKIHGTWFQPGKGPDELGFKNPMPMWRKAFFPW